MFPKPFAKLKVDIEQLVVTPELKPADLEAKLKEMNLL